MGHVVHADVPGGDRRLPIAQAMYRHTTVPQTITNAFVAPLCVRGSHSSLSDQSHRTSTLANFLAVSIEVHHCSAIFAQETMLVLCECHLHSNLDDLATMEIWTRVQRGARVVRRNVLILDIL